MKGSSRGAEPKASSRAQAACSLIAAFGFLPQSGREAHGDVGKGCRKEEREDAQEKRLVQKMRRRKLEETFFSFSFHIEAVTVFQFIWSYLWGAGLGQAIIY